MTETSQSEQEGGASSLKDFCQRNGIGLTTAYAEIAEGRLVARKCRGKTLIRRDEEIAWRKSLPKFESRAA